MKIVIISTQFMGMAESYKNAFIRAGHSCDLLSHDDLCVPGSLSGRIIEHVKRINPSYLRNKYEEEIDRFSKIVVTYVEKNSPDIVLDLLGVNLNAESLSSIYKKTSVFKYMLDLIGSYPYLRRTISLYKKVFTYETADIDNIRSLGAKDVSLLLATYDDEKYYHNNSKKKYDVCFVGSMYSKAHQTRFNLLRQLAAMHPEYSYQFFGIIAKPYQLKRYLSWLVLDHGRVFKNRNLSAREVNRLYNESKICININSYQTFNTWSSRILEMMASGSLTVSNTTPYIHSLLGCGLVEYKQLDELIELIPECLKKIENGNECTSICKNATTIISKYTMVDTVRCILSELN